MARCISGEPPAGYGLRQVITPGYEIILFAGDQEYEYHSDQERVALLEHHG